MLKFPRFSEIILYEDNDLIIVNKPPFLSSLDERNQKAPSLLAMAREYNPAARLCHRIDKETSGALIVSKNDESYRHVSMQFMNREIVKLYHAIAQGIHNFDEEEINLPLTEIKGKARIDKKTGKPATTVFSTLKAYRHYSILLCMPLTGRFHQIRIHLSTVKAPIAADVLYGANPVLLSSFKRNYKISSEQEERPIMNRVALHAYALNFVSPSGDELTVEAPYPSDLETFVKILEKYDV